MTGFSFVEMAREIAESKADITLNAKPQIPRYAPATMIGRDSFSYLTQHINQVDADTVTDEIRSFHIVYMWILGRMTDIYLTRKHLQNMRKHLDAIPQSEKDEYGWRMEMVEQVSSAFFAATKAEARILFGRKVASSSTHTLENVDSE